MHPRRTRVRNGSVSPAVAIAFLFFTVVSMVRAQLVVVQETFTGTTMGSGWVSSSLNGNYTPTLTAATGIDAVGSGWLRLTDTGTQEATAVRNTNAFNSANATIAVKFNYAAYGGTGADGITFFLADASKTFSTGAYGGSLGYANMNAGTTVTSGMSGGYIGLGLDEYGNFAAPNEGKHGGLGTSTTQGAYPNAVSIRGPGDGQTGYDYLGGTSPFSPPFAFPSDTTRPTGDEARTFEIIITATNQLTVYMKAGDTASMLPLFSADLSGYARPDQLVLGFTGSSGGLTDIHEVQGLYLSSLAATLWTNGGGTSTWASSGNWNGYGGTIPALGSDVLLDNHYVSTAQTIAVGANRSVRSLQIDAPFSYTLNGGSLQFNDQGVLGPVGIVVSQGHGAATHTINSDLIADQDFEIKNLSSGALNFGGNVSLGSHTLTLDGSGTGVTTLSTGTISGTGGIVKNDEGKVVLGAANTYSGGTTLNGGTLTVSNNQALGTGGVVLNGGTLASNASNAVGNILTLQGNAGLSNITTSGTLTQTGGNFTLTMAGATQSGNVNLSDTTAGHTLTVNVDSGTSTISGSIRDGAAPGTAAGNLTKTGAGTLVLSGASTFTGNTTVNNGSLRLGASNVLANTSNIIIGSSGLLDLNGFSQQIATLGATGGATINFGSAAGANTFVFGNYTAPTSGVLVINNYQNPGSTDIFATKNGSQNVSTIYISGQGTATLGNVTNTIYGNATLIVPTAVTAIEWDGSSSTSWGTAANWTPANVPTSTQIALFDDAGIARPSVVLSAAASVAGLRFGNSALATAAYNISGATTLTLAGTVPYIQQQNNVQNQTISVNTLAISNTTVVDITGSKNLTISSVISPVGGNTTYGLIKDGLGAGKLILSGANTYGGGTFINNGILQAANGSALGTGNVTILNGATLELSGSITVANGISVTGSGASNAGAIHNVVGTNTLSGTITQTGSSTLTTDTGTTLTLTGNLTGTNVDTVFGGAGNLNVARITTGTGNVTLDGTGTVTFNGTTNANTYTGVTNVNSGTLVLSKTAGTNAIAGDLTIGDGIGGASTATVRLGAANQISNVSAVTLNSDGKLDVNGVTETVGSISGSGVIDNASATATTLTFGDTSVTTFSGTITDTGAALSLVKQGSGKVTLTGNNSYAGTTAVNAGILAIQNSATALGTGAVTVNSGGNLEVANVVGNVTNAFTLFGNGTLANDGAIQSTGGNNTLTGAITLGSSSRIQSDAGSTLTVAGNISGTGFGLNLGGAGNITVTGNLLTSTGGTLTKDGSGYVILNPTLNTSNFTGATTINAGTLEIQKSNALGTTAGGVTVASGGTLAVSGSITVAESPLTLNGAGDSGTGALRNVSGTNTVSGAITLNSATSIGSVAGTLTASGVITGAVGSDLNKVGNGTVTFSGGTANAIAGNITVDAGTLIFNKTAGISANGTGTLTINNSGTVQLGANNQITDTSAVKIDTGGTLSVNGKLETIGSLGDGANGGGSVTLAGGTLTVSQAGNTTFSGSVSGAGTLVKTGAGTLTLAPTAGSNAIAPGTLTLTQGTVQLGADNILGTAITFGGGTLAVNGFSDTLTSATVAASSVIDFNNLGGILNLTNGTWTAGTLTISNWAGSFTGGGASQVLLPGTITGSLLSNITFAGYGTGARLVGSEIVPITGTTYTWNVNADGNWTTNANWSPNTANPNGVGQVANFTNAITANHTVTLDAARTVGYLNFNDDNTYTIASPTNRLTFDVGGGSAQLNVNNTGSATISAGLNLNDALIINQNSTGTLTLSNASAITATAKNLTVAGSGNTVISGNIALTTGSLTKNNGGTLTLGGVNTYTGGTIINGGIVAIANDNNLGGTTGALTLNGGTLENTAIVTLNASRAVTVNAGGGTFQTDANLTYAGAIAGAGTLNKTGTGSLITGGAGANTHTGDINVNAGTLEIAKSAAVGAIGDASNVTVASGATLRFNGTGAYATETIGSLAGGGTVNNASANALALTTGANNASTIFSGVIQNTGGTLGLTKAGTGTFTLTGADTYTGATTVSAGTLNIQNNTALGATSAGTTVSNGAVLEIEAGANGNLTVGAEALTLNGTGVSGNGALRNVAGTNSYAGAITLASASTIKSEAGTLTLSGAIGGAAQNLTLDGAGNITLNGAIGTTTGTLTKTGSGYALLTGSSSYAGATAINAGTVEIQNANGLGTTAAGTTVASGATLALSGGINVGAEALTLNGNGMDSAGALRSLSGTNSYGGTIALGSSTVVGVDSGALTSSGVISGAAGSTLNKVGAGTLVLTGANTYSGATSITEGTIQINSDARLGTAPTTATQARLAINGGTLNTTATMTLNANRGVAIGGAGATVNVNSGTTLTYGGILAGSSGGDLNKTGLGTLVLSGVNTYNGNTNLNAGTLTISSDANLGATGGALNFNGGALSTTASLASTRTINVNGSGSLSVANGTTFTFGGEIDGTGDLNVNLNTSGTLAFNSTIDFSTGSLTLTGGTLALSGVNLSLGTLHITGNTVLDFGNSAASILNVGTLTVDAGVSVTVTNWVNAVDYFLAANFTGATPNQRGGTPENQITFTTPTSYPNSSTQWQGYDHQITPAPEPSTYGVLFIGGCLGWLGFRRWRSSRRVRT